MQSLKGELSSPGLMTHDDHNYVYSTGMFYQVLQGHIYRGCMRGIYIFKALLDMITFNYFDDLATQRNE